MCQFTSLLTEHFDFGAKTTLFRKGQISPKNRTVFYSPKRPYFGGWNRSFRFITLLNGNFLWSFTLRVCISFITRFYVQEKVLRCHNRENSRLPSKFHLELQKLTFDCKSVCVTIILVSPFATTQQNICYCAQSFRISMTFCWFDQMFFSVGL